MISLEIDLERFGTHLEIQVALTLHGFTLHGSHFTRLSEK